LGYFVIILILSNFTPGANTTFASMMLPIAAATWIVVRLIMGNWPDYFFGTTYLASVLPTTVLPSAILTPILGPTLGFILTIPAFYTATAGFPWSFSPTFTTLVSTIFLSSLIPVVGPTTAIIPYISIWIVGIIAGVFGFFLTAPAGLIIAPVGIGTGGTIIFVTALIAGFILNYALTASRVWSTTSTVSLTPLPPVSYSYRGAGQCFRGDYYLSFYTPIRIIYYIDFSHTFNRSSSNPHNLYCDSDPFLATTFLPTTFYLPH